MVKFETLLYDEILAQNYFSCSSGMIFHINRVAYLESLRQAFKITWFVVWLLAHHISNQRSDEPPSTDKSSQNRPIIGYTRIWYTGRSFC